MITLNKPKDQVLDEVENVAYCEVLNSFMEDSVNGELRLSKESIAKAISRATRGSLEELLMHSYGNEDFEKDVGLSE